LSFLSHTGTDAVSKTPALSLMSPSNPAAIALKVVALIEESRGKAGAAPPTLILTALAGS
jgi:hypothetical protein